MLSKKRLSVKAEMGNQGTEEENDGNAGNQDGNAGTKGGNARNVGNQGGNAGNRGENHCIGVELMNYNYGEGQETRNLVILVTV